MTTNQSIQKKVENYVSSFLSEQFGESPASTEAIFRTPFW